MEGTDVIYVKEKFGAEAAAELIKNSLKYIEKHLLKNEKDRLILMEDGKLFADGIAADLFADAKQVPLQSS
jgi:oxygen-independent coproporphyrinogen-3 oxidase